MLAYLRPFFPVALALFITCIPGLSRAASFSFDITEVFGKEIKVMRIDGPIMKGDYDKLMRFLTVSDQEQVFEHTVVSLNSDGGNVSEAARIARFLKRGVYLTIVLEQDQCVSACFFLYLAGSVRLVDLKPAGTTRKPAYLGATNIGYHRAYLSPEEYKKLSLEEAEKITKQIRAVTDSFYEEFMVSPYIVNKINSVSAGSIGWLSEEDRSAYVATKPPWVADMVDLRCGSVPTSGSAAQIWSELQERTSCMYSFLAEERIRIFPKLQGEYISAAKKTINTRR